MVQFAAHRRVSLATLITALVLLLIFAAGGFAAWRVLEDGREQRLAVDSSTQTVTSLLELRNSVFEAVVMRNLALSSPGDQAARQAYDEALAQLRRRQAAMLALAPEGDPQAPAASALSRGLDALAARMQQTIRLVGAEVDLPLLLREAGNERGRLAAAIDTMIARERADLASYNQAYLVKVEQLRTVFVLLLLTAATLAIAAVWGLHRHLSASASRYAELEAAKQVADAANAALGESRGRLQSILDHARDVILLVDAEERVQVANLAASEQFQLTPDELAGSRIRALIPGFGVRDGEVQARRADGSLFPAELSVGHYAEGGAVCVLRDATERHRLDALKSEFVSTVSHELRTPLTSIRASLGLVMGGVVGQLPAQARDLLDIAHKNSERLVLLVNDILDIEKIESGRLDFQRERTSARQLLAQAVTANRAYGSQFGVEFLLDEDGPDAQIYADVQRVQQVLANLLSNAAKFSPRDGKVVVSLGIDAGNVTFSVRDFGRGIPEEFRGRIFQRFAQADSSDARQKGGTGLGLSISKAIIEHHAGTIGFEDAEGGGTRFFFSLPRLVERSAPLPLASPNGQRRRALVVEDDPDIGLLLQRILDQYGWDSELAGNAAEAIDWLDRGHFDAMTLDLMLPDEDGLSLFRRLRRREDGRVLPVVVVSAIADQGRRALNGDAVGVVDWLDKPIDPARLRAALRQALQNHGGPATILHVEDDADITRVVSAVMGDAAQMVPARSLAEARSALAGPDPFALVIIDVGLPDGSGLDLLQDIRALDPPPPVLIFSASDMDARTTRSVAASLVKSRTDNRALQGTILNLIEGTPSAPATEA
ncbi:hybrid sensor histidine kinase/response regulator [Pseudoroseomonas deserti]|uniref:histidine kinase n=1 Tax=Teichococcus deserti TaxID=1817963 RepID=A0A1V2GX59_9PROT|nr:response regulator [Pseudoroseomonas deserti]ONG48945.1 hybrid sensor histidine kinase/response regulator [Pseudoroseomonas deserti]